MVLLNRVHLRKVRVGPRKLNGVAKLIRFKSVQEARAILMGVKKECARDVMKLLRSAISNAENNNGLHVDQLFVSEATVGRSDVTLKRLDVKARSRSGRITKPFSNLSLVLSDGPVAEAGRNKGIQG